VCLCAKKDLHLSNFFKLHELTFYLCNHDSSGTGVLTALKIIEKVSLEQEMCQTSSLHQGKGAGLGGVT
jgi:hypothetical protein